MTARPLRDRRAARHHGLRAERLAELALRFKLFRILDRNFRARGGEIDLVARRGNLIVFVEVKTRAKLFDGMEAVDRGKRQRVAKAARRWLAAHPGLTACNFRADGMFVVPGRWPRHVPGLFELELD